MCKYILLSIIPVTYAGSKLKFALGYIQGISILLAAFPVGFKFGCGHAVVNPLSTTCLNLIFNGNFSILT